jgi:hypothetical protein
MKRPLVLYHANCSDGFGAAYCAWRHFGPGADYAPIAHDEIKTAHDLRGRFPALPGKLVYLLDFAFKRPIMEVLFKVARQTIWLDHHKSALDDWAGVKGEETPERFEEDNLPGRRNIRLVSSRSGTGLAWEWFFSGDPLPTLLAYVEDFDLGRLALPQANAFNLELLGRNQGGNTFERWDEDVRALGYGTEPGEQAQLAAWLARGEIAHGAQMRLVRQMATDARGIILPGCLEKGASLACPPLLVDDAARVLFEQGAPYFAGWWPTTSGVVSCSLRSENGKTDVEAIARRMGGGGNARAAAFRTNLTKLNLWLTA